MLCVLRGERGVVDRAEEDRLVGCVGDTLAFRIGGERGGLAAGCAGGGGPYRV